MNQFEIFNKTDYKIDELKSVDGLLKYACEYLSLDKSIFNVIIVSEEEIKNINREYRNIDKVTDVISFALEDDDVFVKTDFRVLGDIYICFNRAKEQSIAYNHSLEREMCFLALHGLLHLLGYDHMKKEDEEVMFSLQDEILNSYGITR